MKRLALLAFCLALTGLVGPADSQTVIVGQGCPAVGLPATWQWIFIGSGCATVIPPVDGFLLIESGSFLLLESGSKVCLEGKVGC